MKLENTEAYKEHLEKRKEKMKTVKKGANIIHLSYYDGILNEKDIDEFHKVIGKTELELSTYDKSDDFTASFDDFALSVFFVLSQVTVKEIINGTITNATWDAIKYIIGKSWRIVRNKHITKHTSTTSEKKEVNFGMKVSLDENTHFDFHLKGDINENTILTSLDKTFDFLIKQQKNNEYQQAAYVEYDIKKDKWKSTEFSEMIKKIISKQKKNKKK